MQDFKKLQVWVKSHQVTLEIYKASRSFPREELYGLTSQMRRSSASVPTNIAEGCGRIGNEQLRYFLNISFGSASELEYQVILAHDLGYSDAQIFFGLNKQIVEVKQMLASLIQKLRTEN